MAVVIFIFANQLNCAFKGTPSVDLARDFEKWICKHLVADVCAASANNPGLLST